MWVRGLVSGSVVVMGSDTVSPSLLVWFPGLTMFGGRLVLVMVQVKLTVSASAGVPLSVAVTDTGWLPAMCRWRCRRCCRWRG